ncbi:MAG: serine protease [Rhizobiaceae bacterium]
MITTILSALCTVFFLAVPPAFAGKKDNAIARLNYAGLRKKGHCTAVLISKNKALTARHCVENWPRKDLRLVFGYARGEWVELRKIRIIHSHKSQDLAVLCLSKRSRQKPIGVALNFQIKRVQNAKITGYPRSRPHLPVSKTCALQKGGTRARFECPLEPGMSGSPVMMTIKGKRMVVGIASKTSRAFSIIERTNNLPKGGC